MDGKGTGPIDFRSLQRAAARRALQADQMASDADQVASDADQVASDADETAAERDEADATSDQEVSDQDQAHADRDRDRDADPAFSEFYEAGRKAREVGTVRRLASHVNRASTAERRGETADQRDAIAAERDELSRRRDLKAEAIEDTMDASVTVLTQQVRELRGQLAAVRARAAADRERAARDRVDAALERARLEAELHGTYLDALTGAYRREMGTVALEHEIDRARRADGRFVIAKVDVDGLTQVNDTEGRAAADNVLKTLVWYMRANLRSFDPVVRYGGDEFAIGLGGVRVEEVARRFALIDEAVKREVGIGISIGLAELEPDETFEMIAARADAALLDARTRRPK